MARYTGPVCRLCRRVGEKLMLTATLTSPDRSNYDLHVYVVEPEDVPACDEAVNGFRQDHATETTAVDTASLEWGEGTIPNGDDDDRTVYFFIEHVSGPCDQTWTLTVTGNP